MDSPNEWLSARTPPAPDELKEWLTIDERSAPGEGGASLTGPLLKAGLVHLEEAAARPGRDREAAYRLLAADALITYACEAASEAPDVEAALEEILGRVWTEGEVG
jgi:hypothetical protein